MRETKFKDLEDRKHKLSAEILDLTTSKTGLRDSIVVLDEVKKGLQRVIKNFKKLPRTLQKELLHQTIHRVEITPNEVKLVLFGSQPDPEKLKISDFEVLTTGSYGGRNGSGGETRTPDKVINSHLLYQLSYTRTKNDIIIGLGTLCQQRKLLVF